MSSFADQSLSKGTQDKINSITQQAQSGKISWADANSQANGLRQNEGANHTVSSGGNTHWGDGSSLSSYASGSQYTLGQQQKEQRPTQTDLTGYLDDLYQAQMQEKLAGLKSAYGQNKATLEQNGEKIAPTYQAQRNAAAAQNDLGALGWNETAAAYGLNSGTQGQASLSRGVTLQNNLGDLSRAQADAESENSLRISNLAIEYQNAIEQAKQSGNASLASALYEEYVRQANQDTAAAQTAQGQANWEKEYQMALEQNRQSAAGKTQGDSYKTAMAMINSGMMPSSSLLGGANISYADAMQMVNATKPVRRTETQSNSGSGGGGGGYNNGKLTEQEVKRLQTSLGVHADGLWGSASSTAAGGLSAEEAWGKMGGGESGNSNLPDYQTILKNSAAGNYGPQYNVVLTAVQAMKSGGKSVEALSDYLISALESGTINQAGAQTIMQALGI